MSGFVHVVGPCFVCKRIFAFNPHHVPSYDPSLDDPSKPAGRQPICEHCITEANKARREHGLPEWQIHPEAYEAIPAGEL